jgi:hypothetical protein
LFRTFLFFAFVFVIFSDYSRPFFCTLFVLSVSGPMGPIVSVSGPMGHSFLVPAQWANCLWITANGKPLAMPMVFPLALPVTIHWPCQ